MDSSFWKNKKVFITGHSGYKGSWLSLLLKTLGANVNGFSLPRSVSKPDLYSVLDMDSLVNDHRGDVTNHEELLKVIERVDPEIVFHLASQPLVRESYRHPIDTYKTNIMGTINLLDICKNLSSVKSIVVVTSDKCYENVEKDYAYKEDDKLGGFDPYSSSKACAEHVSSSYYSSYFINGDIGVATVRAGNVISGGDWSKDRLIPDLVSTWSKNEIVKIRYPYSFRPWQYVLEPLRGYLMVAQNLFLHPKEYSGAWNFGPNDKILASVIDTVKLASGFWNGKSNWEVVEDILLHEARKLKLDSSKANNKLNWYPIFNFEKCLSETIDWYNKFYSKRYNMLYESKKKINNYIEIFNDRR